MSIGIVTCCFEPVFLTYHPKDAFIFSLQILVFGSSGLLLIFSYQLRVINLDQTSFAYSELIFEGARSQMTIADITKLGQLLSLHVVCVYSAVYEYLVTDSDGKM